MAVGMIGMIVIQCYYLVGIKFNIREVTHIVYVVLKFYFALLKFVRQTVSALFMSDILTR